MRSGLDDSQEVNSLLKLTCFTALLDYYGMQRKPEAYVMLSPAVTVYPIPVPTRFKY